MSDATIVGSDMSVATKEPFLVEGQEINVGDTIVFTTDRPDTRDKEIQIVVSHIERRRYYKVVENKDLFYAIIPALSVRIDNKSSNSIGVIYHEGRKKLILLDESYHNTYRSKGHAREYAIIDVKVIDEKPEVQ